MKNIDISVVIPVYNEEGNLEPLYAEIREVLENLEKEFEIIFIDDGSTDNSKKEILKIKEKDARVRLIILRKNFGQSAAFSAGFLRVKGKKIITMDADLQNDPNDIPLLLNEMDKGFDVISGWRHKRKDNILKRIPSKFQNWLHRRLTGVNIHDSGCSLKLYCQEAVEGLNLFGEMHRYIPAILSKQGFEVGEVKVNHRPRKIGKTKYGYKRLLKGFIDLLYIKFWLEFSTRPLHVFGFISIIISTFTFIFLGYNIIVYGENLQVGPLLLLTAILGLSALQFFIFGLLAEILIRIFYASGKEEYFSIKEEV